MLVEPVLIMASVFAASVVLSGGDVSFKIKALAVFSAVAGFFILLFGFASGRMDIALGVALLLLGRTVSIALAGTGRQIDFFLRGMVAIAAFLGSGVLQTLVPAMFQSGEMIAWGAIYFLLLALWELKLLVSGPGKARWKLLRSEGGFLLVEEEPEEPHRKK